MAQIYVVGHKNPDNDSIMAAYTYAHLKDMLDPDNEYIPVRLGPLPAESEMIFNEYGLEGTPQLIESVGEGDKVILVDHNEMSQAVDGLNNAELVEVVDHHRIADVTTANPIFFFNAPVGSTATIVYKIYKNYDIEFEKGIAACLLSAILTDTVILKSPTATKIDEEAVEELSGILGIDATEFGMKIFKSRGGDEDVAVDEIITRDSKEFDFGGKKVWIAQYETVDLAGMKDRYEEIENAVKSLQTSKGYDAALMMMTDIIVEGSDFVAAGDIAFIEKAFDISFANGPVWMPGVLSRKKQVAAVLIAAE